MISGIVVLVFVIVQLVLIGAMTWFALHTDRRLRRRGRAELEAVMILREALRSFLVLEDGGERIAAVLARLRPSMARRHLERLGASLIAREQMTTLASRVRHDDWVVATLAGATSRRWWKRMDAARLLTLVCGPDDQPLLRKVVMDRNPAVAAAATAGVGRHGGRALVTEMIQKLHTCPPSVRLQQMQELRSHAEIATTILVAAAADTAPTEQLKTMVQFAEILGTPAALSAVVRLSSHPDPAVRARVARALRSAFVPGAVEAAQTLLTDPDWRVRASAARALEGLRLEPAIPELAKALHDSEWWVRFRAAIALAGLGARGQKALEDVIVGNDPFAAEMAISVTGLSNANRLELGA
jgi:HEAT repeat protein